MAFLLGSSAPLSVQKLAIPFVCLLISFLGYGSQYFFAVSPDLAPGPLTTGQTYVFNTLLLCLWWTYYKSCTLDPGRYLFPPVAKGKGTSKSKDAETRKRASNENIDDDDDDDDDDEEDVEGSSNKKYTEASRGKRRRHWCKKCARPKPPRAHHCRTCARCIPKMDHHCPWTSNCVSLQTFPHFLRFLVYTNLSLWTLAYYLYRRFSLLWDSRHLPAYLGPTLPHLVWLTVFTLVTAGTSLALFILLFTTLHGWVFNTTMIEGWEIERHESVVERRETGEEFWSDQLRSQPVEFPYDVGVFRNLGLAMGTANPVLWFLPFAGGPIVAKNADGKGKGVGWQYEENGLNDAEDMWPPPDPAKARHAKVWRQRRRDIEAERDTYEAEGRWTSPEQAKEAFRRRQERDLRRWQNTESGILGELEEVGDGEYEFIDDVYDDESGRGGRRIIIDEGKTGWVNGDGEKLEDYGVDEDAEFDEPHEEGFSDHEDDDIPLSELIRRRKVLTKDSEET